MDVTALVCRTHAMQLLPDVTFPSTPTDRFIDVHALLINMLSWTETLANRQPFYCSIDGKVRNFALEASGARTEPRTVKEIVCDDEADLRDAMREGEFAIGLHHPHICPALSCSSEKDADGKFFVFIVMPMLKRSLQEDYDQRVSKTPMDFYTEGELWSILRDLVGAFSYMQRKNIAHRDIKPGNILMDDRGKVRICDFGYSKRMDVDPAKLQTLVGTVPYFSPKLRSALIQGEKHLTRVNHNVFKSDVYSLGITMIVLTILEIPAFAQDLKNLESDIRVRLTEITNYSARWVKVLSRMLTTEEDARPDFLQLEIELDYPLEFGDDDGFEQMVIENISSPLEMSLKCGLNIIRVGPSESDEVPCLITLKTSEVDENLRMNWTDIVCVVDVSGSMEIERLILMQGALKELVGMLGDRDRISLIAFSDKAERKCPLTVCTEKGKRTLLECIDSLQIGDLTNIYPGFSMALQVLHQRRRSNTEAVVLLFTDGKDTEERPMEMYDQALKEYPINNLKVHTVGLGPEVDTSLLGVIAELGHGEFHYINFPSEIQSSFSATFTKRTNTIARGISVALAVPSDVTVPFSLTRVFTKDGRPQIWVGDMGANSTKTVVFTVKPDLMKLNKKLMQQVAFATITYRDIDGLLSTMDCSLDAKLISWIDTQPMQDEAVFVLWYQAKGAASLEDARSHADIGNFGEALAGLQACINDLDSTIYRGHIAVQAVLSRLRTASELVTSEHAYLQGGRSVLEEMAASLY